MSLKSNPELVRERWKLSKRAQREHRKISSRPVCPVFREAVFEERNRRANVAWRARHKRNGVYVDVAGGMGSFVADVWAIRLLLHAEWGPRAATPTRIARRLWDEAMAHDYARPSLRPMVYRAIKLIKDLEAENDDPGQPPFWGASDLMLNIDADSSRSTAVDASD